LVFGRLSLVAGRWSLVPTLPYEAYKSIYRMKNKLSKCTVLFIIAVFCSCGNNSPEEASVKVFDLAEALKTEETGLTSDYFSEVEMVVLDGKGEWFFPRHVIGGRFYKKYSLFYDQHNRSALGVFSRAGDLVLSLDRKGKGPGEYSGFSEYGMDPAEEKIYVAERYNQKIHWYDLQGNWIETIKIPTKFEHVYCMPDGNLLFQNVRRSDDNLDSCRLFLCNPAGELIKHVWNKPKEINDYSQFLDRDWLKYTESYGFLYRDAPLHDTVYQLNDEYELQPFFVMDPGKMKLPEHIATDFNRSKEWRNYLRTNRFYFSGNTLMISGSLNGWKHFDVDMDSQQITTLSEIRDDLVGWRSPPTECSMDGQYLIQRIYVQIYKDNIDNLVLNEDVIFPDIKEKIITEIKNANENTDIILLYYKLK